MLRRVLLELKSGHVVDLGYGIAAFVPQVALEEGADRGIVKFFLQLVKQEGTVVQAG
jgi:acyl CoA:acetate/3-ketoacid CoA transferase